jgi:alkylhydroperoxidase/carboxymuconolactone decarboxylase family protein YurZ
MPGPNDLLPRDRIEVLWDEFDEVELEKTLKDTLATMYAATANYLQAIGQAFYETTATPPTVDAVSHANRERCLIALLTARGAGFPLAVHIYVGLMESFNDNDELTPDEIANIIFLTAIYAGADDVMRGLATLTTTLNLLKGIADGTDPTKKKEGPVLAALWNAYKGTML